MEPITFAIYKGKGSGKFGAIQFSLSAPHYFLGKLRDYEGKTSSSDEKAAFAISEDGRRVMKEGWKQREGAVFINITSAKSPDVYDWENKIVMALSTTDIGKIIMSLMTGDECKIIHDPGANSEAQGAVQKYLTMSSPNGTAAGCMITATQISGQDKKSHKVPLTGDEVIVLKELLTTAISRILSW